MPQLLPRPLQERLQRLPKGLLEHVERAREIGRELAQRHGVDVERVDLGLAAHDVARALTGESLLEQARLYGLRVKPVQRATPVLLHGPVAARWLQQEDGISDRQVLNAVRWHTTGSKGMGPVEKVVFLADKLDPLKASRYPYLERVRSLAREDLDQALLEFLNHELAYFLSRGHLIHPASIELRNALMMAMDERPSGLAQ